MAIDVDSVHDAGTDYRVIYSRIPHNSWTGNWSGQLQEISVYDKIKVLEEHNNYPNFTDKEEPYILFSFDLNKINSPQQYKAVLYITVYFVKDHRFFVSTIEGKKGTSRKRQVIIISKEDDTNIDIQFKIFTVYPCYK
jgi:hypothetical protein